jgi:hypothetical protein
VAVETLRDFLSRGRNAYHGQRGQGIALSNG